MLIINIFQQKKISHLITLNFILEHKIQLKNIKFRDSRKNYKCINGYV